MQTALQKLVQRELEQGIEREYVSMMKESQVIEEPAPLVLEESGLATSVILKFKSKMAVVTSKQDLVFQGAPGTTTTLRWTVENRAQADWPCQPILQNTTTGEQLPIA